MRSNLIQRQIPLGSKVIFSLKNGRNIGGELIEIGKDHVTLETENGNATIFIEMIGYWEIIENKENNIRNDKEIEQPDKASSVKSFVEEQKSLEDPVVIRKIIEIQARFNAGLQSSRVALEEPDFSLPMAEKPKKYSERKRVEEIWNSIVNRYQYAKKVNELAKHYGRIQPITKQLEELVKLLPVSVTIKRHLAYCYFLSGKEKDAFDLYKSTAKISGQAIDWYNLAAIALRMAQSSVAVYAFYQYFLKISITERIEAWYMFIKLLKSKNNFAVLRELYDNITRDLIVAVLYNFTPTHPTHTKSPLSRQWQPFQRAKYACPT